MSHSIDSFMNLPAVKQLAKLVALSLLLLGVMAMVVLAYWSRHPYQPYPAHLEAIRQREDIRLLETEDAYTMLPAHHQPQTGFIFAPGGLVDGRAYLYRLLPVTEHNIAVFISKPAFHLAVTDRDIFNRIIISHPEIQTWIIGGHSLGGIMACWYADRNPDQINGLIIMGSYCLHDISDNTHPVLSIVGGQDVLIQPKSATNNQELLPAHADVVILPTFQHSDFGDYQISAKNPDSIKADRQIQTDLSRILVEFFQHVSWVHQQ